MLFSFQKYVNPIWYFNLHPEIAGPVYFPDWDELTESEKSYLNWQPGYSSENVSKLDIAWQAWQKGVICSNEGQRLDIREIQPSVSDNYLFLRNYFHPIWGYYVLLIRLISLHNPIREFLSFFKTRKAKRQALFGKVFYHGAGYTDFISGLMKKSPLVTVIIPTLNRYNYLKDALIDLEQQDYSNFEVIIIDQSEPFQADFYRSFRLNLKVIHQEEKALWLARNTAIEQSAAEFLLLYDDDSRVEKDWISQHLKCLDYFGADISSGVSISKVGAKVPENYSFFRWGDQLDTGNVMIRRDVFRKIGLFDRQFEKQRMGDGEFGLRAYLAGFKNISNPYAQRLHLKGAEGGLRQMGSWDGFRSKNWLAPRPIPSVLYLARKYFGNLAALRLLMISVPPSLIPYRFKGNKAMMILGIPIAIVMLPFVLIQVTRSWRLSSRMIKAGEKIKLI